MLRSAPPLIIKPLTGWHLIMAAEILAFHFLALPIRDLSNLHIYRARVIISSFFILSGYKIGLQWLSPKERCWRRESVSFLLRRLLPLIPWLLLADVVSRWLAVWLEIYPWLAPIWTVNPITYCWAVVWGSKEFHRYLLNEALWYMSNQILFYILTPVLVWAFFRARRLSAMVVWLVLIATDYSMWHLASYMEDEPDPVVHQYIETNFVASPWHSCLVHYLLGMATASLVWALRRAPSRLPRLLNYVSLFRSDLILFPAAVYFVTLPPSSWRPVKYPKVDGQFRLSGIVALLLLSYGLDAADKSASSRLLSARWMSRVAPANTNLLSYICQVPIMGLLLGPRAPGPNRALSNVPLIVITWLAVLTIDKYLYSPMDRLSRKLTANIIPTTSPYAVLT